MVPSKRPWVFSCAEAILAASSLWPVDWCTATIWRQMSTAPHFRVYGINWSPSFKYRWRVSPSKWSYPCSCWLCFVVAVGTNGEPLTQQNIAHSVSESFYPCKSSYKSQQSWEYVEFMGYAKCWVPLIIEFAVPYGYNITPTTLREGISALKMNTAENSCLPFPFTDKYNEEVRVCNSHLAPFLMILESLFDAQIDCYSSAHWYRLQDHEEPLRNEQDTVKMVF